MAEKYKYQNEIPTFDKKPVTETPGPSGLNDGMNENGYGAPLAAIEAAERVRQEAERAERQTAIDERARAEGLAASKQGEVERTSNWGWSFGEPNNGGLNEQGYGAPIKATRTARPPAVLDVEPGQDKEPEDDEGKTEIAEGAADFRYSWEGKAKEKADSQLASDLLAAGREASAGQQNIQQQANQYQNQNDMQKYVDAQNAEKVGWTGGYVLDQRRQAEYLKESIKAQLYGAMELQKYGYDSALAAARLSYDLNMMQFAEEYYNNAYSRALQEGQLTGSYISPEYRDMASQYRTAMAIQSDASATQQERDRATKVVDSIKGWLGANGVSEETFNAIIKASDGIQKTLDEKDMQWKQYAAAEQANGESVSQNGIVFQYNEDGTIAQTQGGTYETVDLKTMDADQLLEYANGGSKQRQSYNAYVKNNTEAVLKQGFQQWAKSNGVIAYNDDGSIKTINGSLPAAFAQYVNSDAGKNTMAQYSKYWEGDLKDMVSGIQLSISLPDGSVVPTTYSTLIETINGERKMKDDRAKFADYSDMWNKDLRTDEGRTPDFVSDEITYLYNNLSEGRKDGDVVRLQHHGGGSQDGITLVWSDGGWKQATQSEWKNADNVAIIEGGHFKVATGDFRTKEFIENEEKESASAVSAVAATMLTIKALPQKWKSSKLEEWALNELANYHYENGSLNSGPHSGKPREGDRITINDGNGYSDIVYTGKKWVKA